MTQEEIYQTIDQAIKAKTVLLISSKHGLGSIVKDNAFHPYILGDDSYQYSFVWGYLPDQNLYYKFILDNVVSVKVSPSKYSVREDACYQYSMEEEHFGFLEGFENVYSQAARIAPKQDFVVKKFIVTQGGKVNVMHVAASRGESVHSGEKGFFAYGFKANLKITPTDIKDAIFLVDSIFETPVEAIKEGEKSIKDKMKTAFAEFKKGRKK